MAVTYDIAILGATPAGFAAACRVASKGCSAVVVNAPRREAESPLGDWAPGDFFQTRGLPGGLVRKSRAAAFRRVCYHNADLSAVVEHGGRKVAGYFLKFDQLNAALKAEAVRDGVKVRDSRTSPAIRLKEDSVQLLGGRQVHARLLLVTHGTPSEAVSDLAMPVHSVRRPTMVVAGLEVPLAGKRREEKLHDALHVVELPERTEIGLFFAFGRDLHLRIISFSQASGNRAAELSGMVARLQAAGILPSNLRLGRARGAVWHPPAGIAAETETHVAKRCLLTGTAGGFADTVTGQTLAPSVRSALIAADTAVAALDSDNPQAALTRYKTSWREGLGDYLRPLSTSLQMLLPLVFVNKRLVGKFTKALLFGENI